MSGGSSGGVVPVLELAGVEAGYGKTLVVHDIDIQVPPASVVALIGANGAGKTTLLSTASGLLQPVRGAVLVDGVDVTREQPHQRVRQGVCLIPEGRGIFRSLTVKENLELQIPPWIDDPSIDPAVEAFPLLRDRMHQVAGSLSGGQQQMVAVGRGLMSRPSCLLLDEPSLGLAPLVSRQIFRALVSLREATGLSVILVEQDAEAALRIADRGYVMQRARIVLSGTGVALRADPLTREIYFGGTGERVPGI